MADRAISLHRVFPKVSSSRFMPNITWPAEVQLMRNARLCSARHPAVRTIGLPRLALAFFDVCQPGGEGGEFFVLSPRGAQRFAEIADELSEFCGRAAERRGCRG